MTHGTWMTPRRSFVAVALSIALAASWGCGQSVADKEKTEILGVGTMFVAALQNTVDTGQNKVGDAVTLRTLEDVRVNEMTIVPVGSTIRGSVTHIDPAGRVAGGAELTMRFTELVTADGKSYPISCGPFRLKGKGDAKESALQVGAGAAAGALVGGLFGGKDDIAKGAAAGAVIGTGVAVATKGDQIVLPAGQKMKILLDSPVTITVPTSPAS